MEKLGYDILSRECYPVLQYNEDTKRQEVVCCASLSAVESKMLASGLFDGWEQTLFAGKDGELKALWTEEEPPYACQVTLWRKGIPRPVIELLKWDQCAQYTADGKRLTTFWKERPLIALEKCAKMRAMRSQFRDVVGTVYVKEELHVLAKRHGDALAQQSTTQSGFRNRSLPNLGSTSRAETAEGSTSVSVDVVRTERDFRAVMRSRGLVQDFMLDNVVNQARKERGTWEDEDPEGFRRYAFEVAAKRYNVRR